METEHPYLLAIIAGCAVVAATSAGLIVLNELVHAEEARSVDEYGRRAKRSRSFKAAGSHTPEEWMRFHEGND